MVRRKELVLQSFSATSGLPSIVNGGKDFSEQERYQKPSRIIP